MICTADGGSDARGMWHVWGTREVHVWFWWGNLRERDSLEDLPVDGTRNFKWLLMGMDRSASIGLMWFRIGTSVGLL